MSHNGLEYFITESDRAGIVLSCIETCVVNQERYRRLSIRTRPFDFSTTESVAATSLLFSIKPNLAMFGPIQTSSASAAAASRPTGEQLDALCSRDTDAIKRCVYGSRGIVYRMLLKMVNDADVAEELLQETLYQALISIETFRGDAKVSTWMCGIARNLAYRHFRSRDRYTNVTSDTLAWIDHDEMPSDSASAFDANPRHHAERNERKSMVHHGLSQLPDSYREVIRMRDLKQKSTKEVADELGLSRVNVRVRLHRARQRLASILRPQFDDSTSKSMAAA